MPTGCLHKFSFNMVTFPGTPGCLKRDELAQVGKFYVSYTINFSDICCLYGIKFFIVHKLLSETFLIASKSNN